MQVVKVLRALLLAAMLVLALGTIAACGGDDDEGSSGGGSSAATTEDANREVATVRVLQPVPYGVNTFFFPSYVGEELGYFEEEDIKVEIQTASRDLPIPAFVANGDTDIGAAGADETLQGFAQGGKYKVVYDYYTRSGDIISVPEDSDINDLKQLEGKTIGLASQDDRVFVRTALEVAGADPSKVKLATVGAAGPTVVSSLKKGKIQAYGSGISEAAIVEANLPMRAVLPEGIIGRPAASFLVSQEMIEKQPDVVERFLRAWAKATHAGISSPEAVEAMAREKIESEWENEDVGRSIIEVSIESQTPMGTETYGEIRKDAWQETQEQLKAADVLPREVDLSNVFDTQFIEAANKWDRGEVEQDIEKWLQENGGGS